MPKQKPTTRSKKTVKGKSPDAPIMAESFPRRRARKKLQAITKKLQEVE